MKDLWKIQNIDVKKLCAGPSLTMGGCFKLLSPFEKLGVRLGPENRGPKFGLAEMSLELKFARLSIAFSGLRD